MTVVSPDKVLATRDIIFYYAPYSATNIPPAYTVPWGTAWGTPATMANPWVDGGYTQGGLGFSAEVTRGDIRMDQSLDPVLRPATGRNVSMTANLGQFDLSTLATATGQGTTTTFAPTTADPGYDLWQMGQTVSNNFYSIGFDVHHPGDLMPVRIFGWYAQPNGAEQWTFGPEAAAITPFNVSLFPDPTNGNRVASIYDIIKHT